MGRKPIGEQAMTAAERQQRRRDKMRAFLEKQTKNSNALIRRENREPAPAAGEAGPSRYPFQPA
jgi:hypothetical protein